MNSFYLSSLGQVEHSAVHAPNRTELCEPACEQSCWGEQTLEGDQKRLICSILSGYQADHIFLWASERRWWGWLFRLGALTELLQPWANGRQCPQRGLGHRLASGQPGDSENKRLPHHCLGKALVMGQMGDRGRCYQQTQLQGFILSFPACTFSASMCPLVVL